MPRRRKSSTQLKLSWTMFKTSQECGLKYHLTYKTKLRGRRQRLPFLVGTVCHNLVQKWAESGYPHNFFTTTTILDEFNSQARGITFVDHSKRAELIKRTVRGVMFAENIYRLLQFPQKGAHIEGRHWVSLTPEISLLNGADVYDPVDMTVYDLKMYSQSASNADDRQQLTYAVVHAVRGLPVAKVGFIMPLLKQKVVTTPVTGTQIEAHRDVLVRAGEDMLLGKIPNEPNPSNLCMFCDFRGTPHCPATYRKGDDMINMKQEAAS